MHENVEYLRTFAGFPVALRRFLRRPLAMDEAQRLVAERLESRGDRFLGIAERAIYGVANSPYRALLRRAGCELGDLRDLVSRNGLDATLRRLREAGVYVTFEEFKGRKPIVRGGTTLPVTARDFDNPFARHDLTLTTGGSTGLATAVHHDLDYIAATAPAHMLMLHAWGVLDAPAVHWNQILPGVGLRFILQRARLGRWPSAWYSNHGWFDSKTWLKYDLATLYSIFWMRMSGIPVPVPTIVRPHEAHVIACRIRQLLDQHGLCLSYSNTSSALRIALAAEDAGFRLEGATFRVGGEPVTAAKIAPLRRLGARVLPAYGSIETSSVGLGCPSPREIDHVHLASDSMALITYPVEIHDDTSVQAFNLTSLIDASPKVMLNYQIDDCGVVEERRCGCALHAAGFTTSLHTIRSYSKVLGEGVTFMGNELQDILEHVLPARFGGSPLDYQLMEDEDVNGLTRIYLVISPRIAIASGDDPVDVLLTAVSAGSPRGDSTASVWKQAGTLRVLRQEPVPTARGKLLPVRRRPSTEQKT